MSLANQLAALPEGKEVLIIVAGVVVTGRVVQTTDDAEKLYLALANAAVSGTKLALFRCERSAVQGFGLLTQ